LIVRWPEMKYDIKKFIIGFFTMANHCLLLILVVVLLVLALVPVPVVDLVMFVVHHQLKIDYL
jgi:hypothetical protein